MSSTSLYPSHERYMRNSHVAGHIDLGGKIFLSPHLGGGKNYTQETGTLQKLFCQ